MTRHQGPSCDNQHMEEQAKAVACLREDTGACRTETVMTEKDVWRQMIRANVMMMNATIMMS